MENLYQINWDIIKKRMLLLWENEILDRPCVSVKCPKDQKQPIRNTRPWGNESLEEYYLNPECILERNLDTFEKTYFAGDALPVLFPYWGTGGHAKYLESGEQFKTHAKFTSKTIWLDSVFEEYERFNFTFDAQNPIFQAELQTMKFLAKEGMGKFFVGMPDNCGSYDALATLRGTEDFIMDLLDRPDEVRKAGNQMVDTLIQSSDAMFQAVKENNDGGSTMGWMGLWSPGKVMQLQCDLSVMISPDMFEEFIVEELERSARWLDHSVYHLDGIEQARFLDQLLSIREINMIQWTQVAGQPDVTANFHYIQRIQKAGKGIFLFIDKNQLDAVLDNVLPEGRMLVVSGAENREEADDIVDYVAKHSFRKRLY